MATGCVVEPASKSMASWRSELGSLKACGVAEGDRRVRECREALAYWKVRQAIDAVRGRLSPIGIDVLVSELLGIAR
ncbi:hypothetical protein [Mycobacteroides abscessus]|uniref:hypothetical protein n=1 Tax=Mycobacteroides abscessus TaxID=36809 RepID=UPI000378056B|nr:hypothetical protein [Mycobacteroides abscessus]